MPTEPVHTETAVVKTYEHDPVVQEWYRFYQQLEAGLIDPTCEHGGQYVAFAQGRVIDYGPNPAILRREVATRLGIEPESVVVSFLDNLFLSRTT